MKEGFFRPEKYFTSLSNFYKKKTAIILVFCFLLVIFGSIVVFSEETSDILKAGNRLGFQKAEDVLANKAQVEGDNRIRVDGGSISYNHDGKFREYKNLKEGAKFTFKDKKLASCEFETTADSIYSFGNHNVKVPKGSKVTFKDNKVTVEVLKDSLIEKPERISGSKENDVKVDYKFLESSDTIKIKDGKEYTLTKSGSGVSISYDGKVDAFLAEGEYSLNGLKIGEFDKDNRKNYLFFDGAKHDLKEGSYISIGDKIMIGAAKGFESPSVQFLKGNGILDIKEKDFIVMQSNGGTITVEGRNSEGKIPRITSQGEYTIFTGDKVIRYKEEYKSKYGGPLLKQNKNNFGVDFGTAGTTPMQIVTLDSSGLRTGTWDVVVDNSRGIKSGLHDALENDYVRVGGGQVSSIRSSFYSLTKEEQDKLKTISPDLQKQFISMNADQIRTGLSKISTQPTTPTDNKPPTTTIALPFKDKAALATHNAVIKARGRNVQWDENLAKGAYEWSKYMAENLRDLQHADIQNIPGVSSENIAMFTSNTPLTPEQVGAKFTNQWMTSRDGHKENILKNWGKTGIGVYVTKDSRYGYVYWATERFH